MILQGLSVLFVIQNVIVVRCELIQTMQRDGTFFRQFTGNAQQTMMSDIQSGKLGEAALGQPVDALSSTTSCLTGSGTNDPYLGKIELNEAVYCDARADRNVQGLTCCQPQSPEDINLKFWLFQGLGQGPVELLWFERSESKKIRYADQVIYVIHGFLDSFQNSVWMNKTRDGWFNRLEGRAAIIYVDWSHGNQGAYPQAAANIRSVGAAVAFSILKWNIAHKTLLVGHSLGGQTIGEVGKFIRKRSPGTKVKECHALDPAGPMFDGASPEIALSPDDCHLVQVIHSASGAEPNESVLQAVGKGKLGSTVQAGHCDFWVNCGHDSFIESHMKAPKVYASAASGACGQSYVAYRCLDCQEVREANTCQDDRSLMIPIPPDAINCTPNTPHQDYVIWTNDADDVNYCNKL